MKKETYQSSRLFFKDKDHLDIYFRDYPISGLDRGEDFLFHGGLFKTNEIGDLTLPWRKKFNEKYFVFEHISPGMDPTNCFYYLCYPNQKIIFNCGNAPIQDRLAYSKNGSISIETGAAPRSELKLYSSDMKTITEYELPTRPFGRQYRGCYSSKNFLILENDNYDCYKILIEPQDNENTENNPLIKIKESKYLFSNEDFNIYSDYAGNSNIIIMVPNNSTRGYNIYNTETETMYENVFYKPEGFVMLNANANGYFHHINGRNLIFYYSYIYKNSTTVIGQTLHMVEFFDDGQVKKYNLMDFPGDSYIYIGDVFLKYYNKVYYLYIYRYFYQSTVKINDLFISSNLQTFIKKDLPDYIEIKNMINPSLTRKLFLNGMGDDYSDTNESNLTGISSSLRSVLFENNKKIYNTKDLFFKNSKWHSIGPYDDVIYLDNLLFLESENNFYITEGEISYLGNHSEQLLWKEYYKDEEGISSE